MDTLNNKIETMDNFFFNNVDNTLNRSSIYTNEKIYICHNCGGRNHNTRYCRKAVNSYGIILYRNKTINIREYLLICRRHSIGYIQFIRGKYTFDKLDYIQKLINVMSNEEIMNIQYKSFDDQWKDIWMDSQKRSNKAEQDYMNSKNKYEILKRGFEKDGINKDINFFIKNKMTYYSEPEWGFPKGRKNNGELDLVSALREFEEETMISKNNITMVEMPIYRENYKSYDEVYYKNSYYVAEYIGDDSEILIVNPSSKEQYAEVSKLGFYSLEECIMKIRDYNIEKKQMLISLDKALQKKQYKQNYRNYQNNEILLE